MDFGQLLSALINFGLLWLTLVEFGQVCLTLDDFGRILSFGLLILENNMQNKSNKYSKSINMLIKRELQPCEYVIIEGGWIHSYKKSVGHFVKSVEHLLHKSVGHKTCPTVWDKSMGHKTGHNNDLMSS